MQLFPFIGHIPVWKMLMSYYVLRKSVNSVTESILFVLGGLLKYLCIASVHVLKKTVMYVLFSDIQVSIIFFVVVQNFKFFIFFEFFSFR